MSGWGKFGVTLYCSTTLAATAAVGFALFIGATPSKINLFDNNRNVRNWVFIAAAVSLAYITLSAFTMFYVLTKTKKPISDLTISQKKNEIADGDNPSLLLQHHTNQPIKSTIDSQKLECDGVNYSNLQNTEKDVGQMNKEYNNVGVPLDYLRSNYFDCMPSSQLQVDNSRTEFIGNMYEESGRETGKEQDWKEIMKIPNRLVLGKNCYC